MPWRTSEVPLALHPANPRLLINAQIVSQQAKLRTMAFNALKQDTARCAEVISLTPFSKPVANQFAPTSKITCTNCLDMAWKHYIPRMISQGARGKTENNIQAIMLANWFIILDAHPKACCQGICCANKLDHTPLATRVYLTTSTHLPPQFFFKVCNLMTCSETGAPSHVT